MAGRFAASKFKNTHARTPKREECVTDLPIGGLSSTNNGVAAGRTFLAFHIDGDGGKLGILRNNATGRKTREDVAVLAAHTDGAADFAFLPFQNDVLATISRSDDLRLWALSSADENGNPGVEAAGAGVFLGEDGGECLMTHPTAADVLGVGSQDGAFVVDTQAGKVVATLATGWGEKAGSGGWDGDGRLLLVQDRANRLAVFDPRSGTAPVQTLQSVHSGKGRETRAMYLGQEGRILTSGFSKMRQREIFLYDVRKAEEPMHQQPFESSTGLILPLYDPDTKLIFLAGKGSNKINLCELLSKAPYLGEVGNISPPEQTLGACLLPKWGLDVMQGEVARVFQLNRNSLFPVPCCVPRKTYRDFLPELFPPTKASTPGASAKDWLGGSDAQAPKYSLDPADAAKVDREPVTAATGQAPIKTLTKETVSDIIGKADVVSSPAPPTPQPLKPTPRSNGVSNGSNGQSNGSNGTNGHQANGASEGVQFRSTNGHGKRAEVDESGDAKPAKIDLTADYADRPKSTFVGLPAPKVQLRSTTDGASRPPASNRATIAVAPGASLFGARRTKFKHTSVKLETAKDKIFYNLRKINTQLPLECGGFAVSDLWAAVPMGGAAGLVAIFDLTQPQKIPDGLIPGIENGGMIGDLRWDPFDPSRILVGLDTGIVNLWRIPSQGVEEILSEPAKSWPAHGSKLINVEWNPVASDLLATSGLDGEVRLWDCGEVEPQPKLRLSHPKALLAMAWSAHGDRLATACRDGVVRVFRPQEGTEAVVQAPRLTSTKAARVLWVLNDEFLLVSGFSRGSQRELALLRAETLELVGTKQFDQASVLLVPHYDFDANIVYVTGKGDVTLNMFEVIEEAPWFLDIPAWKDKEPHQGFSFHQKRLCDVRKVEVARCWRLKLSEIQPMSFTVPRRHLDKYQNDLFPEAIARWAPALGAKDWLAGQCPGACFQDLNPGMELLYPEVSSAKAPPKPSPAKPALSPKPRPAAPPSLAEFIPPPAKEDLVSSIGSRMDALRDDKGLEQDRFEGVAEEEWHEH